MTETIRIGGLELRFLQDKDSTGGSLDLFEMTVPHQGRMPVAHYHRDWEETVYGLSGIITFTIAGEPRRIGPGETLFIPRGTVHGFSNDSGADAVCLSLLTPGVLGPQYFRELSALAAKGPPDEAVVREIMGRYGLIPA
jgi:quercetin dioxygenase-like cupin family protein